MQNFGSEQSKGPLKSKYFIGFYWAHTPETGIQHYPTNPYMESTGKEEERKAGELMEARPHIRHR